MAKKLNGEWQKLNSERQKTGECQKLNDELQKTKL